MCRSGLGFAVLRNTLSPISWTERSLNFALAHGCAVRGLDFTKFTFYRPMCSCRTVRMSQYKRRWTPLDFDSPSYTPLPRMRSKIDWSATDVSAAFVLSKLDEMESMCSLLCYFPKSTRLETHASPALCLCTIKGYTKYRCFFCALFSKHWNTLDMFLLPASFPKPWEFLSMSLSFV
jgi:hypothetical protein